MAQSRFLDSRKMAGKMTLPVPQESRRGEDGQEHLQQLKAGAASGVGRTGTPQNSQAPL